MKKLHVQSRAVCQNKDVLVMLDNIWLSMWTWLFDTSARPIQRDVHGGSPTPIMVDKQDIPATPFRSNEMISPPTAFCLHHPHLARSSHRLPPSRDVTPFLVLHLSPADRITLPPPGCLCFHLCSTFININQCLFIHDSEHSLARFR